MTTKTPAILLLALALAACSEEPKPTSTMDLDGLEVLLVPEGQDRWAVSLRTDVCIVGRLGDEVRLDGAFPTGDEAPESWVTLDSVEVDDRDGCVVMGGEMELPLRAAHIEQVAISARIDQRRNALSVDRMYGAGCADIEGTALELGLEPFSPTCD